MVLKLLTLLGAANALYLTVISTLYSGQCIFFSCSSILSHTSASFLSIPIALFGLAYFIMMNLSLTREAWISLHCRRVVTCLATLYVLYLSILQIGFIDGICGYCLFNAAIIIALFIMDRSYQLSPLDWRTPSFLRSCGIFLLIIIVTVATWTGLTKSVQSDTPLFSSTAVLIDGQSYSLADLDRPLRLKKNELLRSLNTLRKKEVDRLVLSKAAKEKGLSISDYLFQVIPAASYQVSSADVSLFLKSRPQIRKPKGMPDSIFNNRIKQVLNSKKRRDQIANHVDVLYETYSVQLRLPKPELLLPNRNPYGSPKKGPSTAKIKIVEYSDFECPHCAKMHQNLNTFFANYPDDVQIEFRHFPLAFHKQATPAAKAAFCAYKQDKFWPFSDQLFLRQSKLNSQTFDEIAITVELDVDRFHACLKSKEAADAVSNDAQSGKELGITATPTLILNGKLIKKIPTEREMKTYLSNDN